MAIDFGKTASDYARHRAGFPASFFERLAAQGIGRPGQRALDLGTGTGTVARGLALRGARVTGLDPSEALLEHARDLDRESGVSVEYVVGRAEATGLPPATFDVVTAGQCWHWFDAPAAGREIRRLLLPGGVLVIAHFDWIPLSGNVVEATERLIEQHNPGWTMGGMQGIHPRYLRDVAEAGFLGIETFSYDLDVPYTHESWRGRIRASAGVAASLAPGEVEAFDRALGVLLNERFPGDPLPVFHRVWWLTAVAPA